MRKANKDKMDPNNIVIIPESFLLMIEVAKTTTNTPKIYEQLNKNWFKVGLKPIFPINIECEKIAKLMRKVKIKKQTVSFLRD